MLALRLIALASIFAAQTAHACSCVPPRLTRTVLPADGTVGFPTDGAIRVFLTGGFPPALRAAMASEHRLRDEQGALVPMRSSVVGTRLDLIPEAPLRPSSRYTLESVFAYDAAGVRVDDTERLRSDPAVLRGAWFPVAFFRTGSGPAVARSEAPRAGAAQIHFAIGGGDCGPGVGLNVEVALPSSIGATDVLELRVRGMGVVETVPAAGAARMYASDMLCNPDPVSLPARNSMDVQLAWIDATGREIGVTRWTRARGRPSQPLPRGWAAHRRTAPAGAPPWTSIAIGTVRPLGDPGPAGCPHGLEIATSHELPDAQGPWMYEAHSALTSGGLVAYNLLNDGRGQTHLWRFSVDAGTGARILSGTLGSPAIAAADNTSIYYVTTAYDPQTNDPTSTLYAFSSDSRRRWEQRLTSQGEYFRIALARGLVLAAWQARDAQFDNYAAWALFHPVSGTPIFAPRVSAHRIHINGGMAAAFVRDRFFVAFPSEREEAQLVSIGRDGIEIADRALGIPHDGPFDLVSTGTGAALVTAHDGTISATFLDASGNIERGPIAVSTGIGGRDNRKPRAAWTGQVLAVGWETNPSGRTYVTAIDPTGRVAPALALDRDRHTCTIGLTAFGGALIANYTLDPYASPRTMTASLRCRAHPPAGAPQRIQP